MDELFKNAKKAIGAIVSDEELKNQLLTNSQLIKNLSENQTECSRQISAMNERMIAFETEMKRVLCILEEIQQETKELVVWKQKIETVAKILAGVSQSSCLPMSNKDLLPKEESPKDKEVLVPEKEEQWPKKFYADSFSSFSPYGFCVDDFQSEYMGQLYIIDQSSATEASFSVNDQLDFSQLLSNYKYGLKPVCNELQRNDNPSRLTVVEPGMLSFNGIIWEIKKKIDINIL